MQPSIEFVGIEVDDFIASKLSPRLCGFVTAVGNVSNTALTGYTVRLYDGSETIIYDNDALFIAASDRRWQEQMEAFNYLTLQE